MSFKVAQFLDVADGTKPGQFTIGDRDTADRLDELPDIYRQLMDEPITAIIAVMGGTGRPNLTPIWFDHDGEQVLLNFAEHRKKVEWLHANPEFTICLMNPENPYHWMSIKGTVVNEIHEDDPDEGHRATEQVDRIWTKYTGAEPPYGLRDPELDERRILMEARVDSVALFGQP